MDGHLTRRLLRRMDRAVPSIRSRVWVQGMCEHTHIHTYILLHPTATSSMLLHPSTVLERLQSSIQKNGDGDGDGKARKSQRAYQNHSFATEGSKKVHQRRLRSRAARPRPRPEAGTDPAATVPNPNPYRRRTVARHRVRNPARRNGAGTRVAPGRRGSGDGRQSGTGPAPSAAPFLIAVFVPRAVGFNGVVTGRREWEQAAGLERSPRMRRRRSPHGHTRRPHT